MPSCFHLLPWLCQHCYSFHWGKHETETALLRYTFFQINPDIIMILNLNLGPWTLFKLKMTLGLLSHPWFLEPWNRQKSLQHIWQRFSYLLDKWIAKISKKNFFSRWLFEIIHIIRFEMRMDRPDKSENTFGTSHKLSKHLTFYGSPLISH